MTIFQKPVKVGVAGVGSLGYHHARIYNILPETELVGVFDINKERATQVASEFQTRAFGSLQELAVACEAASVVVPTDFHREVAGLLLENNLHILVEKPIAITTAEAEELVHLAQQNNAILQVGHIERFNPVLSFPDLKASVPRFIEAHRLAPYPPMREGEKPRGTEVSVVLDLMIHDLEIILHLVGAQVKNIHAVGVPVLSDSEDIANVRLLFTNGCVANITASRISPEKMRKIRVFLEDAYISLDYQNQSGEIYRKTAFGIQSQEIPIEKGEPLAFELRAFAECVAKRTEPVVSGEHAAEALKLAVNILEVMREESS